MANGPCQIRHAVVTIEDSTICYLPETISDGQLRWFLENREYFVKIRNKFDYTFIDIPTDEEYYQLSSNKKIKIFYKLLKEKNQLEKENRR